jgi:hypothetical protein
MCAEVTMTKYQRRCFEMFVRVRGFGESFRELFPAGSPGGEALAAVAREVTAIESLLVGQLRAVDSRLWRAKERAAMVGFLLRMTRTARQIARIERRVDRRFLMPTPRTDASLLETARVFLREATPMEDQFVRLGMPTTFVDDLRSRADSFERAIRWRRGAQVEAASVRAGLEQAFRRGFDAVLTFDVVIRNSRADHPVALGTWKATRRIDRQRSRQARRRVAAA